MNNSHVYMLCLRLMFSTSCPGAVLNLAESALTYQTSVYVIGFPANGRRRRGGGGKADDI